MLQKKLWRASVEFNLTEHCNLSCEHCDHSSGFLSTKFADLDEYQRDLEALEKVLHTGELRLLGGEPLMHPRLLDFLRVARETKIASKTVLITNGVLLHKAPAEMWELIDGMWISVYSGVKLRFDWEWIQQMADKHNIFIWRKDISHFDEVLLTEEVKSSQLLDMIFHNCYRAHVYSCNTIYEGRYYLCEPSVWMEKRLRLHGVEYKNDDTDSVPIHDNPNLRDDLANLISRRKPLDACRYCLGSFSQSVVNKQLNKAGKQDLLAKQPEDLSGLISPGWILPQAYIAENQPDE